MPTSPGSELIAMPSIAASAGSQMPDCSSSGDIISARSKLSFCQSATGTNRYKGVVAYVHMTCGTRAHGLWHARTSGPLFLLLSLSLSLLYKYYQQPIPKGSFRLTAAPGLRKKIAGLPGKQTGS